jgi:hypothetical protein
VSWQALDSGVDASVWALAVHGGDLIVGGGFTSAGGAAANRIARWDGTGWHALGTGFNSSVHALAVFNNEIVAGGAFAFAGSTAVSFIAHWTGSSWQPLGNGLDLNVWAMTVHQDELVVGGIFGTAGRHFGQPHRVLERLGVAEARVGHGRSGLRSGRV